MDELKKFARNVEEKLKDLELDIEKDFQEAVSFIDNELHDVRKFIRDDLHDAEKDIIKNVVKRDTLEIYKDEVSNLLDLVSKLKDVITGTESVFDDVKGALLGPDRQTSLDALIKLMTDNAADFYKNLTHFSTITIGCDAKVELVAGVEASGYAGMNFLAPLDTTQYRILADISASGGAEAGGDAGLTMGIWLGDPKDLQGGFIAASFDVTDFVGAGVVLIFSISDHPKMIGAVVDFNSGADDGVSIDCGYTISMKVDS